MFPRSIISDQEPFSENQTGPVVCPVLFPLGLLSNVVIAK